MLIAGVHGITDAYSRSAQEGLARRKAYVTVLPSMYRSLLQADKLDATLMALDRAQVQSENELNALLYEVADESGLTMKSLTIERVAESESRAPGPVH